MASPVKIYWDSCAWLALINEEPGRKEDVDAVYTQARQGTIELWSSTLSIIEANRLISEVNVARPLPPDSLVALDDLFFQRFVKLVPVDIDIAIRARKLIRETPGLKKKPDAIQTSLRPCAGTFRHFTPTMVVTCYISTEMLSVMTARQWRSPCQSILSREACLQKLEPSQSDKFKEAARAIECDDDEARFDERMKKLVKYRPVVRTGGKQKSTSDE